MLYMHTCSCTDYTTAALTLQVLGTLTMSGIRRSIAVQLPLTQNTIHYPHSTVILFRLSLFLPGASMIWHSTLRMTTILCFFSLAFKPLLSPLSLHVFSPYPLSFISIGEHRLACLSPSVLTNISLHAASFHSSILSSTRALLLSPYH